MIFVENSIRKTLKLFTAKAFKRYSLEFNAYKGFRTI